jgi:hypothetical protein
MTLRLNTTRDHLLNEDPRTVVLTSQGMMATVTWAQKYEVTRREVQASEGLFTMQDVVWELDASQVPDAVAPVEGALVTDSDAGESWTVIEASKQVWETVWRLVCRKTRGGAAPTPPLFAPSLDFSDSRNSQYLGAL